jgi:hypothetical protein
VGCVVVLNVNGFMWELLFSDCSRQLSIHL